MVQPQRGMSGPPATPVTRSPVRGQGLCVSIYVINWCLRHVPTHSFCVETRLSASGCVWIHQFIDLAVQNHIVFGPHLVTGVNNQYKFWFDDWIPELVVFPQVECLFWRQTRSLRTSVGPIHELSVSVDGRRLSRFSFFLYSIAPDRF